MTEIRKDIPGYEGYEASNLGNIKTLLGGRRKTRGSVILKPSLVGRRKCYLAVGLIKEGKRHNEYVHRLVANTFIDNPMGKPEVNHINCIKTDNRVINLEWVTSHENHIHSVQNGLQKHLSGPENHRSKIIYQKNEKGIIVGVYKGVKEVASKYNCHAHKVRNHLCGKTNFFFGTILYYP